MTTTNEILLFALVGVLAAAIGAACGILAYFGGERGERRRFEGELAPLRAAISEVADSFDHWTKRERRRDAVGKVAPPGEGAPGGNTRQERLREVGRRFMGRPM